MNRPNLLSPEAIVLARMMGELIAIYDNGSDKGIVRGIAELNRYRDTLRKHREDMVKRGWLPATQ